MKISLIVSDIDGTLLPEGTDVQDGIKELAELIREYDLPFSLASGRPLQGMTELRKALGISLPMVVCNGSAIWREGECIREEWLDAGTMRPVLEYADSLGMAIIVSREGIDQVYRKNEYTESRPVGQVYIHEYQLGHGMSGKPLQRAGHAVGLAHDVKLGIDLFHGRLQVAQGRFFVFYNQGLHINGKVTLKFFSLSSMVMSRPKSKR